MPLMVPCFGCGFEPELVYSPYDYDSKTGSLFHLVASGGPTFSWSMSWAQIPKNGLFSSWNRWEAGQVFGKGKRLTVYRGWLGVSTKIWNHFSRVQCQLEMPSLSRHLFVDEFGIRQIPSSAGVISLLGCTCFLWKFLDFSVAMCVCVHQILPKWIGTCPESKWRK